MSRASLRAVEIPPLKPSDFPALTTWIGRARTLYCTCATCIRWTLGWMGGSLTLGSRRPGPSPNFSVPLTSPCGNYVFFRGGSSEDSVTGVIAGHSPPRKNNTSSDGRVGWSAKLMACTHTCVLGVSVCSCLACDSPQSIQAAFRRSGEHLAEGVMMPWDAVERGRSCIDAKSRSCLQIKRLRRAANPTIHTHTHTPVTYAENPQRIRKPKTCSRMQMIPQVRKMKEPVVSHFWQHLHNVFCRPTSPAVATILPIVSSFQ